MWMTQFLRYQFLSMDAGNVALNRHAFNGGLLNAIKDIAHFMTAPHFMEIRVVHIIVPVH